MVNKIGVIVRGASRRYTSIAVLFDGNKAATLLHKNYLQFETDGVSTSDAEK